jgi:A/G-specific adenine glycosylase
VDVQDLDGPAAGELRKERLRHWFIENRRTFPWRQYTAEWHVLLAEMLLLRTRAEIVAKHVSRLIDRFPTPEAMANEQLGVVEEALRPLGLRWRAHRLHELSVVLVNKYGGRVPMERSELLRLPGVGPYVASTTLSTLAGHRVLLTDTNTVRVATRVAGLELAGDVRRRKDVQGAIASLMNGQTAASEWLAVLDLAATVCLPRNPRCPECPIVRLCNFGKQRVGTGADLMLDTS